MNPKQGRRLATHSRSSACGSFRLPAPTDAKSRGDGGPGALSAVNHEGRGDMGCLKSEISLTRQSFSPFDKFSWRNLTAEPQAFFVRAEQARIMKYFPTPLPPPHRMLPKCSIVSVFLLFFYAQGQTVTGKLTSLLAVAWFCHLAGKLEQALPLGSPVVGCHCWVLLNLSAESARDLTLTSQQQIPKEGHQAFLGVIKRKIYLPHGHSNCCYYLSH